MVGWLVGWLDGWSDGWTVDWNGGALRFIESGQSVKRAYARVDSGISRRRGTESSDVRAAPCSSSSPFDYRLSLSRGFETEFNLTNLNRYGYGYFCKRYIASLDGRNFRGNLVDRRSVGIPVGKILR